VGKVVAVVGAAVLLVMLGAGLVFAEAAANPAPSSVLASARSFVARAHRVAYTETVTVTEPSGSASLVRTLSVTGVAAWGASGEGSADWTVNDGKLTYEYRSVGSSGVWVRVGTSAAAMAAASWVAGRDFPTFEKARYASSGSTGLDPTTAVIADDMETGLAVAPLVRAASSASRSGDARHLAVHESGASVLGPDNDMGMLDGVLVFDAADRPIGFDVTARGVTVRVQATLAWDSGPAVSIAPPADSAVAVRL
jgi:hypothetical protein